MIYTVTLNPALDLEYEVPNITFNEVLRAVRSRGDAGGKGFNVSRMLKVLGEPSVALAFLGGHTGAYLDEQLNALGLTTDVVWVEGETRKNVSIVDSEGKRYLKVNESGPYIPPGAQEALMERVHHLAAPGDWWVLSGSLPPGVPGQFYATLIEILHRAGAYTVLDTSGEALLEGCRARPYLVKPNREEAAAVTGLPADTPLQLAAIARRFLDMGIRFVIISLGEQGALMATTDGMWFASPPPIEERNPVGAGDAMVAGLVWALRQGREPAEVLRVGVACGAAAAGQEGTGVGTWQQVEALAPQVSVVKIIEAIKEG